MLGMTNQNIDPRRRAVLAFDLTSIPAGSTVTAARLSLLVTRNPFQSLTMHDFSIHRLTSDWGEGTSSVTGAGGLGTLSTTGDATWAHTSFNTESWTTAGGDFVPTSSAHDVCWERRSYGNLVVSRVAGRCSSVGEFTCRQLWLDHYWPRGIAQDGAKVLPVGRVRLPPFWM